MKLLQVLHHCDLSTFGWCLRRKSLPALTRVSRKISATADGHLYVLAILLLALTEFSDWSLCLLVALLLERPLYALLKSQFKRNRPPQAIPGFQSVIQPSDQFSFPSGHTSAAFLFATLAFLLLPVSGWLLFPWAGSVAASRVLLGVHFPTDTLAGALLGCTMALMSFELLNPAL